MKQRLRSYATRYFVRPHPCVVFQSPAQVTDVMLQVHDTAVLQQTRQPGKDNLWILCGLLYGLGAVLPNLTCHHFAHQVCTLLCCMSPGQVP